jgi:hypothetical protein
LKRRWIGTRCEPLWIEDCLLAKLMACRSVINVIGVTERLAKEAEQENTSIYFGQLFDRLLVKQHSIFDAFIVSLKTSSPGVLG